MGRAWRVRRKTLPQSSFAIVATAATGEIMSLTLQRPRAPCAALELTTVPGLAGGLVRARTKEIEKVSHGRRFFHEAFLFPWRHDRPLLDPP
jgi:hypothetical protein